MVMVFSSAFDNISAIWWLKTTTTTKQTNKQKQMDTCHNVEQFVYKTMCKNIFNCVIFIYVVHIFAIFNQEKKM